MSSLDVSHVLFPVLAADAVPHGPAPDFRVPHRADSGLVPDSAAELFRPHLAAHPHTLCVAPMMEWTDRHCRMLHRLVAPHATLYTEMVTVGALQHGPRDRLLRFSAEEHPVAFQIGGSDPESMAACAKMVAAAGFDEINMNVGCPSNRVLQGAIGVCLMAEPARVADCVRAMCEAVSIPVTVKCRLGVDDQDDYSFLVRFLSEVHEAGCSVFLVHARKAILGKLTPAQNRDVPPLDHARVHRLKHDFPHLTIVINGGLQSAGAAAEHLQHVDGVMIGRAAYRNPWLLAQLEQRLFATPLPADQHAVFERFLPYVEHELVHGTRLTDITRHLHGLFAGCRGAAQYRRMLAELPRAGTPGLPGLLRAAAVVSRESRMEEAACSTG